MASKKKGYPTSTPAYPQAPPQQMDAGSVYPGSAQYPGQPQYMGQPQYPGQPQYSSQPQYPGQPQYSSQSQYPGQPYQGYPNMVPGPYQQPGPPPPYAPGVPQYQQPGPAYPGTVVVQSGFDAGARFDHGSVSLPPPPPGVMPSTAQIAQAQGHNVVVTKKKGNYFTGGSDGGYTIW